MKGFLSLCEVFVSINVDTFMFCLSAFYATKECVKHCYVQFTLLFHLFISSGSSPIVI